MVETPSGREKDNGNGNGAPPWLSAVLKFGVGSAIGMYLVWWMTAVAGPQLGTIKLRLDDHISAMASSEIENSKFRHALLALTAMNCKANAHSAYERDLCEAIVKGWDR